MKKYFTLLFLMINSFVFGQITEITLQEAKKPVQPGEIILKQGEWSSRSQSESEMLQIFKDEIEKKYPHQTVVVRNFVYKKRRDVSYGYDHVFFLE